MRVTHLRGSLFFFVIDVCEKMLLLSMSVLHITYTTWNLFAGFGFVTFEEPDTVDKVVEIHFHEINDKVVSILHPLPVGVALHCGTFCCASFRMAESLRPTNKIMCLCIQR